MSVSLQRAEVGVLFNGLKPEKTTFIGFSADPGLLTTRSNELASEGLKGLTLAANRCFQRTESWIGGTRASIGQVTEAPLLGGVPDLYPLAVGARRRQSLFSGRLCCHTAFLPTVRTSVSSTLAGLHALFTGKLKAPGRGLHANAAGGRRCHRNS